MRLFLAMILLGLSTLALAADDDCENPLTSMDISRCMGIAVDEADEELKKYLQASIDHYQDDDETARLISASQEAWEEYRTQHCKTVFHIWSDGTSASEKMGECRLRLTKARTHEIWQAFLTSDDGKATDLPEPGKAKKAD